ncbi:uncharacterized protein BX664DRAFT_356226 [Halteromyces radiatus]|uniref:uncharacterized protein n=1 Tax=Halteromyces radiatus TaxID=101107 RepID=UPI00221F5481|nr:uncharacterized protein BX664DRAFT_356226 [Halteromyces radiatus]KAI8096926.1 hypothetical protein BX664DRAFT_356226 [Halteromyces radiatus]
MVRLGLSSFSTIALAAVFFQGSEAHVEFSNDTVKPNTVLNTSLVVPHGCSGSDTVGLSVTAPDSINIGITPQNVQNWTLTVNYRDSSNKTVKDFSWTGGYLAHDGRQEFGVVLAIPQVDLSQQPNVTALFPTVQTCLNSTSNWTSDPKAAGYNATRDKPAPQIVITNQVDESSNGQATPSSNPSSGAMTFYTQGSTLPLIAAGMAIVAGVLF